VQEKDSFEHTYSQYPIILSFFFSLKIFLALTPVVLEEKCKIKGEDLKPPEY